MSRASYNGQDPLITHHEVDLYGASRATNVPLGMMTSDKEPLMCDGNRLGRGEWLSQDKCLSPDIGKERFQHDRSRLADDFLPGVPHSRSVALSRRDGLSCCINRVRGV